MMNMASIPTETILAFLFLLIGIIGYFLRIQHTDTRDTTKDVAILKGQIQLIKLEADSKIDKLAALTQMEMRQMADTVKVLSHSVSQVNTTVMESHKTVIKIFDELYKKD